jgi:hypothetical protein
VKCLHDQVRVKPVENFKNVGYCNSAKRFSSTVSIDRKKSIYRPYIMDDFLSIMILKVKKYKK